MAINFPTSLDNFTNPLGTQTLDSPDHAGQHSDANDALEALEAKIGVGAGTPTANKLLVGSGNGTATWNTTWNGGTIGTAAISASTIGTSTITGGTINSAAMGTPTVTGGTFNSVTLGTPTVTSPVIQGIVDGWTTSTDTWTYASASTFTIAGVDRTAIYTKGTRLKFTQTTVKYAVVVASSFSTDTTVTIAVNTDYTIANATITAPYYSHQNGPAGYPVLFNWTPTYSASGSMTYTSVTKVFAIYNISASGLLTGQFKFYGTTGGTASTFIKFTYPIAKSSTIDDYVTVGSCSTELNASSAGVIQYEVSSSSLIIRLYNSANYSLSGSQYNTGTFCYFI